MAVFSNSRDSLERRKLPHPAKTPSPASPLNHSSIARGGKRVSKAVMQAKAKPKLFDAPPQGKGPTKRTPRSLIEQQQLAKEELFEPECVVA